MPELKKSDTHTYDLVLEELKKINADPGSMNEFNNMSKNERERYVVDRVFAHYIEQKKDSTDLTNNRARVKTLRPNTLQPNQRYRANGFIENSIIVTILGLSTILGLIIGSIIALYK